MARVMRTYHERFRFGHPRGADFYAVAEEVSGRDLDDFFAQTVESPGVLDPAILDLTSEKAPQARGKVAGRRRRSRDRRGEGRRARTRSGRERDAELPQRPRAAPARRADPAGRGRAHLRRPGARAPPLGRRPPLGEVGVRAPREAPRGPARSRRQARPRRRPPEQRPPPRARPGRGPQARHRLPLLAAAGHGPAGNVSRMNLLTATATALAPRRPQPRASCCSSGARTSSSPRSRSIPALRLPQRRARQRSGRRRVPASLLAAALRRPDALRARLVRGRRASSSPWSSY